MTYFRKDKHRFRFIAWAWAWKLKTSKDTGNPVFIHGNSIISKIL